MLTKQNKIDSVQEIIKKIKKSATVLMVDFTGLKVSEVSKLRELLRKEGIDVKVMKKTLIQRAMNESGIRKFDVFQFPSSVALIFSPEEGPIVSKETYNFSKKQKQLTILGGVFDGNFVRAETVIAMAKLPTRDGLLSQLAGTFNNIVGSFVVALDQISKNKA